MSISGNDYTQELHQIVEAAYKKRTALQIIGGNSKAFYGRKPVGEAVTVNRHHGVIHYEPTELVLTARAGTRLTDIEALLAEHNQMLPFEPPHFTETATLGGAVATGLSGPRRPYYGAVRDFVLGVRILNGKAEDLRFGGEVMKNVAGYDVSRLMTGALGTLGLLLEISIKVLPKPAYETSLIQVCTAEEGMQKLACFSTESLPISAACHDGENLHIRLSGAEQAVSKAATQLGGQPLDNAAPFWESVREQRHTFFQQTIPLWRISVASFAPMTDYPAPVFIDWGGAQRWMFSEHTADDIWQLAESQGGHATLFRHGDRTDEVFQPPAPLLKALHMNIKLAFDPYLIFNQGRLSSAY